MEYTTVILLIHLIGLALGAGAAFFLDLVVMKFCVTHRISRGMYQFIEFATRITFVGLAFLWSTGLIFLSYLAAIGPEAFANPKIWAKLSIVAVLTLNGIYIHMVVLPAIKGNIGKTIFHGIGIGKQNLMLASGAISTISWITPIVLGALRDIDLGLPFTQAYSVFFGVYLVAVAGGILIALMFGHQLRGQLAEKNLRRSIETSYHLS